MLALEGFREEVEEELGLSTSFLSDLHNEHSPRLYSTSKCKPRLQLDQEESYLVLCKPHNYGILCRGFSRKLQSTKSSHSLQWDQDPLVKGGLIIKDLRPTFQGSSESCVCSQNMSANFLITGKFTMKHITALPESPMFAEKKRSMTWLHNWSFLDEHKSMLLFLLLAEYPILILLHILGM